MPQPWVAPATVGVVLVLAFVWMVLQVISAGPFIAWDWVAREWVYARRAQGGAATFLEVQAFVTGERWATVPVVMGASALVAYRRGGLRPLYAVIAGLATIAAIGYPVKFGLGRSSPVTGVDLLHAGGQAFPSGHAANTAFTATMVVFLLYGSAGLRPDPRRFRRGVVVVVALLAVNGPLVAWMGYHWLSDIPAGWLMGFIAVCVSLTVLHWPDRIPAVPEEDDDEPGFPALPSPLPSLSAGQAASEIRSRTPARRVARASAGSPR
ncbi:phosphatase PAP2 family protein [Myceligenerans halotolerans]